MVDKETLAQINGECGRPSDTDPEWRVAIEPSYDFLPFIESQLRLAPEQRLIQHDQILRFIFEVTREGDEVLLIG
jgi:hypothetical protein